MLLFYYSLQVSESWFQTFANPCNSVSHIDVQNAAASLAPWLLYSRLMFHRSDLAQANLCRYITDSFSPKKQNPAPQESSVKVLEVVAILCSKLSNYAVV